MKKIGSCIGMLHKNTKAMPVTGLLHHTTTNHMYVDPYYVIVIKSKEINFKYYLKVLHPHCVLFKCYTEKHSLTQHIQKFCRLLVSALLTSHRQTFFFNQKPSSGTYPCI